MPDEVLVGTAESFEAVDRRIIMLRGEKIGVFRVDGRFYAYANRCRHQGGPVCEGRILGKIEAVLEDDRNVLRERMSDTVRHLVCPWHGYEYELTTGGAAGDARLTLTSYEVVERDGMVYVRA